MASTSRRALSSRGLSGIRPPSRYAGWLGGLIHLHQELARLGLEVRDLKPYQEHILYELDNGVDESAFADLHAWWAYDTQKLLKRGKGRSRPAKPRIDLTIAFTSKGNLSVTWQPTGFVNDEPGPNSDWVHWRRVPGVGNYRPENELLFIRDLRTPYGRIRSDANPKADSALPDYFQRPEMKKEVARWRKEYRRDDRTIDATLLQIAEGLVRQLQHRLDQTFDVTMITDIYVEWREDEEKSHASEHPLRKWEIEDVADRTERLEREELAGLPDKYGCTIEAFVQAFAGADKSKRSGKKLDPNSKDDRVTKALKKAGYSKVTLSIAKRYRELLERYRPELFPQPKSEATILPFCRNPRS